MAKLSQYLFGWLRCNSCLWVQRGLVGVTFVGISAILSARFYWEPTLKVGTIVSQDIRVPKDITIEDVEATYTARQKAQQEIPPIYKVDEDASLRCRQQLEQLLLKGDKIRESAGPMPFLPIEVLGLEEQKQVRVMGDREWRLVQQEAKLSPQRPLAQKLGQVFQRSPQEFQSLVGKYRSGAPALYPSPQETARRGLYRQLAQYHRFGMGARQICPAGIFRTITQGRDRARCTPRITVTAAKGFAPSPHRQRSATARDRYTQPGGNS
jgi:hypothetical protein